MNLISSVVICALVSTSSAGLLKDLVSPRGLDVGSGLTVHLDSNNDNVTKNSSYLERHALRLGFGGYGLSFGKPKGKEAIEVGFYANENKNGEGRGKKMGDMLLPVFMGFKMTGLVAFTFALVSAFVVKALGIAKLSLIAASLITASKLFYPDPSYQPSVVEIDHAGSENVPVIAEYPGDEMAYHQTAASNMFAYNNYIPSAIGAESAVNYATLETAASNQVNATSAAPQQVAVVQQQQTPLARRRDYKKRKPSKMPLVTIHRYTIQT